MSDLHTLRREVLDLLADALTPDLIVKPQDAGCRSVDEYVSVALRDGLSGYGGASWSRAYAADVEMVLRRVRYALLAVPR